MEKRTAQNPLLKLISEDSMEEALEALKKEKDMLRSTQKYLITYRARRSKLPWKKELAVYKIADFFEKAMEKGKTGQVAAPKPVNRIRAPVTWDAKFDSRRGVLYLATKDKGLLEVYRGCCSIIRKRKFKNLPDKFGWVQVFMKDKSIYGLNSLGNFLAEFEGKKLKTTLQLAYFGHFVEENYGRCVREQIIQPKWLLSDGKRLYLHYTIKVVEEDSEEDAQYFFGISEVRTGFLAGVHVDMKLYGGRIQGDHLKERALLISQSEIVKIGRKKYLFTGGSTSELVAVDLKTKEKYVLVKALPGNYISRFVVLEKPEFQEYVVITGESSGSSTSYLHVMKIGPELEEMERVTVELKDTPVIIPLTIIRYKDYKELFGGK